MPSKLISKLALLIAEFFYCGRFPYAPGTVGTIGALVIWIPAVYYAWPWWVNWPLLALLFVVGVWASKYGIEHYQKEDPKQVVIDEVVGVGFPFLVIEASLWQVAAAFVLFRFFDILKPWPIKMAERLPGAWGVMLDDVVAGIFTMAIILLAQQFIV